MISFDFISDDEFRTSLEADAAELETCYANGASKAVHVLAGSIVEALLLDSLAALPANAGTATALLRSDLQQLIEHARAANIISDRTAQLSTVVRSYRNLIHPGRIIRLGEKVTTDSATVARTLVSMVVDDVEARKRQNYGYTAQQIAVKVEADKTALPIIPHLLKGLNPIELERLLFRVLPERYIALVSSCEKEPDPGVLINLRTCYRSAFDAADEALKRRALQRVVSVVKENDGFYVEIYEKAFFQGSDLKYLADGDRDVIKCHVLGQLKSDPSFDLVRASRGMLAFLTNSEVGGYAHSLLGVIALAKDRSAAAEATNILTSDYIFSPREQDEVIKKTVERYVEFYEQRANTLVLERLKPVRSAVLSSSDDDIPF